MTIGIYALKFSEQVLYIGQSKNIEKRFKEHKYLINIDKHTNKILTAYYTYGTPTLSILCICSETNLNMYEDIYIKYYDSYNAGLNTLENSTDMPKPDNRGMNHGLSKYTYNQIVGVFNLLIALPIIKYTEISSITEVGYQTVGNIAALTEHTWLKTEFPDKYKVLEKLKGTRNKNREVNTAEMQGKKYPDVLSPKGIVYTNITNVSKFMREHRITSCRFYDLLNGKASKIMGWVTI